MSGPKMLLVFSLLLFLLLAGCKNSQTLQTELSIPYRLDDERRDFMLDHPQYEKYFGVKYREAAIPESLDIISATVSTTDKHYVFQVEVGGNIEKCIDKYKGAVQFQIAVDKDLDGGTDVNIVTTDQSGQAVVITAGKFEIVVLLKDDGSAESARSIANVQVLNKANVIVKKSTIKFQVSKEILGQSFNWHVFSGFAMPPAKPIPTIVPHLYYVPVVDMAKSELCNSIMGSGTLWRESSPSESERRK